jgi:CBS domain containing-hemolysin-like protein
MIAIVGIAAAFVAAVLLSALFSGYETGFVSANPVRIRRFAEEEHNTRARQLLAYLKEPDRMLTTLLIGNNIVLVIGTMVLAERLDQLATTLIVTPIFLMFGEIIPKSVFRTHPNRLSLALLPIIRIIRIVLMPLSLPVTLLTRGLLRLTGRGEQTIQPLMSSLEDMRVLVDESATQGNIEPAEQEMIHSVIDLQSLQAKEIMVPRIHIQALPDTATRQEVVDLLMESGRTRIPIYHETIDEVIGVVSAHDLLCDRNGRDKGVGDYLRDVMHVPDTMKVDDLLKALRAGKQHMAIVTDEYGGTDGLVTLEDILEEIFGEIQDEYDQEERQLHKVGPNAYVVDARMALEMLSESIGVELKDEEVETVGGWVMHLSGRIPKQGQVIEQDHFRITVLAAAATRVNKIRLELKAGPGTDANDQQ